MKASSVEIIVSEKINPELIAHFEASLHSNNFEFSLKSHIGAEEEFKGEADDVRKSHHGKRVKEFQI